jgi:hypothetical protein
MTEIGEKEALIADLERALAQANGRLIQLTEELGPWKARALRAEQLVGEGLNIDRINQWLNTKGYGIVDRATGKRWGE